MQGLKKHTLRINVTACLAVARSDGKTKIWTTAIAKEIIVAQRLGCQGSFHACLLINIQVMF
jgi:hypothetical protein